MITPELRDKFKTLYYKKFNIQLSNEDATEMTTDLINLVKVLLKSDQKSNTTKANIQERRLHEAIRTQQFQ